MIEFWKSNVITKNLSNPFKAVFLLNKQSFLSTNVIIMAFMLLLVLSCGKTEESVSEGEDIVTVLEVESRTSFRMNMKDLEYCYEALAVAIKSQNWKKIKKHTMQLKETSCIVMTGIKTEELPEDFVMFDSEYHLSTVKLAEAAEAGEMDQLNIEYEKVQQACDNCHIKYKDE